MAKDKVARGLAQDARSLQDLSTNEKFIYSIEKENDRLIMSWNTQNDVITLNSIVYEGATLFDLFVTKNMVANSHFDADLSGYTVNAGTPTWVDDVYNTQNGSLKAFGATSQQIKQDFSVTIGDQYFVAVKVKLERYVSGGGLGYQFLGQVQALKSVSTDGFETLSSVYTSSNTATNLIVGTISTADADGYVDDVVVVNLSGFSVAPSAAIMTDLYEIYLKILKGEEATITVAEKYKLVTENEFLTNDQDARESFISAMNEKAQEIGMSNSNFINPHGLNIAGQYTNAKDILMLGIHAMGYDGIARVWGKSSYTFKTKDVSKREITISTTVTGTSLKNYYHVFGGKTGTANYVSNLLAIVNAPNNNLFVGVVLDATDEDRFADAKDLFDLATLYMDEGYIEPEPVNDIAATKAAVCLMPNHNPLSYQQYDIPLLWSKGETVSEVPASITKILTAMIMLDNISNLNDTFEFVSSDIISSYEPRFYVGDIITYKDALHCMLLPSSNDTAMAIARVIGKKIFLR